MDILEDVNKMSRLPQPGNNTAFEEIPNSSDDSASDSNFDFSPKTVKCKNPTLFASDEPNCVSMANIDVNYEEMDARVAELPDMSNGSFLRRQQQRILEENSKKAESKNKKPKQPQTTIARNAFKHNVLMRGLLQRNGTTYTDNGKNIYINGAYLSPTEEDPDIYTIHKTNAINVTDEYRFAYRGKKTKINPHLPATQKVDDSDFIFTMRQK